MHMPRYDRLLRTGRFPALTAPTLDWLVLFALAIAGSLGACLAHAGTDAGAGAEPSGIDAKRASALTVTIENIEQAQGHLMIEIAGSAAAFSGEAAPAASLVLPAAQGSVTFTYTGFPAGQYAIRVMQDVDGDGKLKTNMVGMPKEPWGMSNNAMGRFGPPSWDDASFVLPADAPHVITLR